MSSMSGSTQIGSRKLHFAYSPSSEVDFNHCTPYRVKDLFFSFNQAEEETTKHCAAIKQIKEEIHVVREQVETRKEASVETQTMIDRLEEKLDEQKNRIKEKEQTVKESDGKIKKHQEAVDRANDEQQQIIKDMDIDILKAMVVAKERAPNDDEDGANKKRRVS